MALYTFIFLIHSVILINDSEIFLNYAEIFLYYSEIFLNDSEMFINYTRIFLSDSGICVVYIFTKSTFLHYHTIIILFDNQSWLFKFHDYV